MIANNKRNNSKLMQKTIFVSNLSEDVWPFIDCMEKSEKKIEIELNAYLGDLHFMAGAGKKDLIYVGPSDIDDSLKEYYCNLFGVDDIPTFKPQKHLGNTCSDILNDKKLFDKLVKITKPASRVNLVSYSSTKTFFELGEKLRKRGVKIAYPESPLKGAGWTVDFFGSKSGIRQMGELMPDGYICSDVHEAAQIATNVYLKKGSVVIKTNKGHSGAGILIYRKGELPKDYDKCLKHLEWVFSTELYWNKFQIIVEDYIDPNLEIGGGFPNVEFKISEKGEIEFLYACGNRVTADGVFNGIEIGKGSMDGKSPQEMKKAADFLGKKYKEAGYRGYFDVDFVYGKDNKLYINESNARRTGGTHLYLIASKLLGNKFTTEHYTLCKNMHDMKKPVKSFSDLLNKFKPLLFDRKKKEGVIFCSSNLLKYGKLAYIIVGKNKQKASELETKLYSLDN